MSRIPIPLPAKSKYHAKRTDGYASKKEAQRAAALELLQKLGKIKDLVKQPSYELIPKDKLGRAVTYRADFAYYEGENETKTDTHTTTTWVERVEDVKGFKTEVYKLKRRLMYSVHGIVVQEV